MELSATNPLPFKQPFLCLRVEHPGQRVEDWYVEVGGKVGKYTRRNKCTPLLQIVCNHLAAHGMTVTKFGTYKGSAGPSHFLRQGAFFRRLHDELEKIELKKEPAVKPPTFSRFW